MNIGASIQKVKTTVSEFKAYAAQTLGNVKQKMIATASGFKMAATFAGKRKSLRHDNSGVLALWRNATIGLGALTALSAAATYSAIHGDPNELLTREITTGFLGSMTLLMASPYLVERLTR